MARSTCVVEGRAGKQPELRFTSNGTAVANFSVAVTDRVKKGEEWEDGDTTWYSITAWKSLAETVAEIVDKGDVVLVTGRMKLDTWAGQDGAERSGIGVTADSVGLVRKKSGDPKPY